MRLSIYRYDPDKDEKPRMQDYDIPLEPTDRMLLDALVRIKTHDDSLSSENTSIAICSSYVNVFS